MSTFRERVIQAIIDNENDDRHREFWGVSVDTEHGADVTFWYGRHEISAVVVVSEEGFTQAAVDRACAAVKSLERGEPEDYFLTPIVAIPGDYMEMEIPQLDGYEVWEEFGLHWFGAYAVSPAATRQQEEAS